jgi:hypothetical protein
MSGSTLNLELQLGHLTFNIMFTLRDDCLVFGWSGIEVEGLQHECLTFFYGHVVCAADGASNKLVFADRVKLERFFAAGASKL